MSNVIVIGAGLAGLASALMLREHGHNVRIVTRGWGGMLLSKGTIDVLGWDAQGAIVTDVAAALKDFIKDRPDHPYARIGAQCVDAGARWLADYLPFFEDSSQESEVNSLLPSAIGAVLPSAYLPHSMKASALCDGGKYVVVGIENFKDFPCELIAANLNASHAVNVSARSASVQLPVRGVNERDASGTTLARAFDGYLDAGELSSLVQQLSGIIRPGETVLLPSVLGLETQAYEQLEKRIGAPVGEVPTPPPSVAGRRINDYLVHSCRKSRIDIMLNAYARGVCAEKAGSEHNEAKEKASDTTTSSACVSAVRVRVAGGEKTIPVDAVVYAGGGFESGALVKDSYGAIRESVFDFPVMQPEDGDPFGAGVKVNSYMRPVDPHTGVELYRNVYCVGAILAGARPWDEGSGEGIALGSAYAAVQAINTAQAANMVQGINTAQVANTARAASEEDGDVQ